MPAAPTCGTGQIIRWRWSPARSALTVTAAGPAARSSHDGTPHLLYTGLRGPVTLPCLAAASDQDLIRWSRYEKNPVIAGPPPEPGVRAFRDHAAWQAGSAWYQVIGGGLADRGGALFLYRSEDLRNWQYLGILAAAVDHGLEGQIWECPDVFTLGHTTVVIVSVHGMGAPVRDVDDREKSPAAHSRPGPAAGATPADRYYAPQSVSLTDGRRIGIGWIRESLDELTGQDRARVGVMSLPRELQLEDGKWRRARSGSTTTRASWRCLVPPPVRRPSSATGTDATKRWS